MTSCWCKPFYFKFKERWRGNIKYTIRNIYIYTNIQNTIEDRSWNVQIGCSLHSLSLRFIHLTNSFQFNLWLIFLSKRGKALNSLLGWVWNSSASRATSISAWMSLVWLGVRCLPLRRVTRSSLSVASNRCLRTLRDLLILSADGSFRFEPSPFKKDLRKLFRCSKCKSRLKFFPFPPRLL